MTTESIKNSSFRGVVHRNQKIMLCLFPDNRQLLGDFRKEFPFAKWSQTHSAWYLPDTTLYRTRLNLSVPGVGDNWLPKLYEYSKVEFVKFRNALTQKVFSPNTIKTYYKTKKPTRVDWLYTV